MSPSSEPRLARWRERVQRTLATGGARVLQWIRSRRLQPDAIGVAVFPDRLLLARVAGGWRHPRIHREVIDLAPVPAGAPAWQAALDALAARVADGTLAGAQVSIVLSSHFVHYALVPWNTLLKSEAEQLAYARQRFVRIYGEAAQAWDLRLSRSGARQSRVACAIAPALRVALDEVMAPLGRRYVSLQPHLMASFNRWHRHLGAQSRWLAVVEPGLVCLALLRQGQWQSVRTMRLGPDGFGQLSELLARERCLVENCDDADLVSVLAAALPAAQALESGPWTVENLKPVVPHRMTPRTDVALAAAMDA